MSVLLWLTVRN